MEETKKAIEITKATKEAIEKFYDGIFLEHSSKHLKYYERDLPVNLRKKDEFKEKETPDAKEKFVAEMSKYIKQNKTPYDIDLSLVVECFRRATGIENEGKIMEAVQAVQSAEKKARVVEEEDLKIRPGM